MDSDLIKRGLAISYAVSGLVRRIDGEDWIRISEVRKSLNDVPTVEPQKEIVPVCKVIFDKEQLQEIVDNRISEMVEKPQNGTCKTCIHRDPEDKKCDCGELERQGCIFRVSDDYYCKYYEKGDAE